MIARRIGERFADADLQRAIGILGVDKKGEEFFQLTLGGSAGDDIAIGQILGPALPENEALQAIEALIDAFLTLRTGKERFLETYRRLGAALFKEAVYAAA